MSMSINLHGVKHIGVRTQHIAPSDGGEPYVNTTFFFVDKDGGMVDICLLVCDAEVEFIGDTSAWDFTQGKRRERRDAEILSRLTPEERETSIQWARDTYTPGGPIDVYWHPIAKQECEAMNREIQNELREEI